MNVQKVVLEAKSRGMVPFITVIPVHPDVLRDRKDIAEQIGETARVAMTDQVQKWLKEH